MATYTQAISGTSAFRPKIKYVLVERGYIHVFELSFFILNKRDATCKARTISVNIVL